MKMGPSKSILHLLKKISLFIILSTLQHKLIVQKMNISRKKYEKQRWNNTNQL